MIVHHSDSIMSTYPVSVVTLLRTRMEHKKPTIVYSPAVEELSAAYLCDLIVWYMYQTKTPKIKCSVSKLLCEILAPYLSFDWETQMGDVVNTPRMWELVVKYFTDQGVVFWYEPRIHGYKYVREHDMGITIKLDDSAKF